MKKIGFVDYYISEWHANNYPAWISEVCAKTGRDYRVSYVYAEQNVSPVDGLTTDAWCKKFGAERVNSIEELAEKADCIMVLAPSNPETHERLTEVALKCGKPVYVDKTFAPNAEIAFKMINLASENHTPMFSTSALRFADELTEYRGGKTADSCVITGSGKFDEYCIHVFEMAVTIMKSEVERIRMDIGKSNPVFTLEFSGGRRVVTIHSESWGMPFLVNVAKGSETFYSAITSDYFKKFIGAVIDFFETKKPQVNSSETLAVAKIIDAAKIAMNCKDTWIEIK